jgi:hypothetical protein
VDQPGSRISSVNLIHPLHSRWSSQPGCRNGLMNERSNRAVLLVSLLAVATALSAMGAGAAGATGNARPAGATLVSHSVQTARAQAACQADGATVSTAMAAYEAQNPGRQPTAADLESSARGGSYLQGWPYNPAYYRYSINSRGVLELAIMKAVGPPFVYTTAMRYKGPQDCTGVRALPGTQAVLRAVSACEADGATVATAIAAYKYEHPGKLPTKAGLLTTANGGPFLQGWPYNPAYYRYSINSRGVLELAIVKSSGPPVTFRAPTPYREPQNCSFG